MEDVFAHGKRTHIRRLNSAERYTSADYFHLLDVLYHHAFRAYRGNPNPIAPTGVLSVPVDIYHDESMVDEIRNTLVGSRTVVDHEGCSLHLDIQAKRLLIIPESYGALMHYTYESDSLKKRPDAKTTGTTLVVDIGYETTDLSLFEGLKFQRDRAETVRRTGMGIITRAIHSYVNTALRSADVSRIDRALHAIVGKAPGVPKNIEPAPGVYIDVAEVYDLEIQHLAARIAQEILTLFPEAISRLLLTGGGGYHLARALRAELPALTIEVAPNADLANVLGGFTALKLQMNRLS